MAIGGVIFDLDGTLLDTLKDIADPANETLRAHGYPEHPIESYRIFVGDGVRTLMERTLPEEARQPDIIDTMVDSMRGRYRKYLNQSTQPYPGIPELVEALSQAGLKLATLSNKLDDLTKDCIAHYFPSAPFDPVMGQSDRFPKKPDPAAALAIAQGWGLQPAQVAFIGDTSTDMDTATGAGMRPLGAAWGFRTREELIKHGAEAVVDTAKEAGEILLGWR